MGVRSQALREWPGHPRQRRLASSRRRLLAQRRRRACGDPHGVRSHDCARCQDGKAGAELWSRRLGRPCTGPEAAGRPGLLHHELAAGDRSRRDRVGSSVMDWWGHRPSPPGDVRGFDVRSGRLLWTFNTVPQTGEPGVETWEQESWKEAGNANVWAPMSADEELGYVYLPVSTPTNDYYGGHRPGDGLYGESLVCLDVATGKKVWHYQLVHHGLWDYDPPAAPNLIDITVGGKRIKAVAQVTKQALVYVSDRVTGQPVWSIEEQPVAASSVP